MPAKYPQVPLTATIDIKLTLLAVAPTISRRQLEITYRVQTSSTEKKLEHDFPLTFRIPKGHKRKKIEMTAGFVVLTELASLADAANE